MGADARDAWRTRTNQRPHPAGSFVRGRPHPRRPTLRHFLETRADSEHSSAVIAACDLARYYGLLARELAALSFSRADPDLDGVEGIAAPGFLWTPRGTCGQITLRDRR